MAEPIDELKRRLLKKEIELSAMQNEKIEPEIGELKGHKVEQINPINSKTRQLFNKNVRDEMKKMKEI